MQCLQDGFAGASRGVCGASGGTARALGKLLGELSGVLAELLAGVLAELPGVEIFILALLSILLNPENLIG